MGVGAGILRNVDPGIVVDEQRPFRQRTTPVPLGARPHAHRRLDEVVPDEQPLDAFELSALRRLVGVARALCRLLLASPCIVAIAHD